MDGAVICAGAVVIMAVMIAISIQRYRAEQKRLARLRPLHPLFTDTACRVRVRQPLERQGRWRRAYLFVSSKRVVAYARRGDDTPLFDCAPHEIEGFWRPVKYEPGQNVIELHAQIDAAWVILEAQLWRSSMMGLVRALKALVSEDVIRAYRQRRPYIYREPAAARVATQDIHGAWELGEPFMLYLMPSALVFLGQQGRVERVIALRDVQNIVTVRRLDTDGDEGLLRFDLLSTQDTLALALDDYGGWAEAVAGAARRTLEEPITRKGKPDDDASDDYDEVVWATDDYVVGDDGELRLRQ